MKVPAPLCSLPHQSATPAMLLVAVCSAYASSHDTQYWPGISPASVLTTAECLRRVHRTADGKLALRRHATAFVIDFSGVQCIICRPSK
jgi:hypothetical protein